MKHERDLQAQVAISRLSYAYCTGIDSGRPKGTARLFGRGAWFLDPDQTLRGFEAVSAFLCEHVILYDGVPKTRHVARRMPTVSSTSDPSSPTGSATCPGLCATLSSAGGTRL